MSDQDRRRTPEELDALLAALPPLDDEAIAQAWWVTGRTASTCPDAPHRGPEGPNEDIGQCWTCGSLSFNMRPPGETFGEHLDDCSLPERHERACQPGGSGHPPSRKIRG